VGVSQTAALNRGRHLYSAGRPSRWALAHILVLSSVQQTFQCYNVPDKLHLAAWLTVAVWAVTRCRSRGRCTMTARLLLQARSVHSVFSVQRTCPSHLTTSQSPLTFGVDLPGTGSGNMASDIGHANAVGRRFVARCRLFCCIYVPRLFGWIFWMSNIKCTCWRSGVAMTSLFLHGTHCLQLRHGTC